VKNSLKLVLFSLITVILFQSCTRNVPSEGDCVQVEIYNDSGVWEGGLVKIENLLVKENISFKVVNSTNIKSKGFSPCARVFIVPGGNPEDYEISLGVNGILEIRSFISRGGSYLGICAGAELAAKRQVWEGHSYPSMLGLYSGVAVAPIDEIAPWPQNAWTIIEIKENPIYSGANSLKAFYWGGSYFQGGNFRTIAVYAVNQKPAIIFGHYGAGNWVLSGPHIEYAPETAPLFSDILDWLLR